MFLMRKIGKFVRGSATPLQIIMAAALGGMIGFTPGFLQAPGLNLALLALLVILSANLFAAGLTALLALGVSLLVMPITFALGRVLLDGPTQPLFQAAINAPVFALFGFEYYLVTGGVIFGLVFGLAIGAALVIALSSFRRRMATLEEGSERYRKVASTWWAKTLAFIFIGGGHGKKTYAELAARRYGNPVRVLGVVLVIGVAALGAIAWMLLDEPIATALAKSGLERANGATVDLDSADLALDESRITLRGLAMADPDALDTDVLRAATVEMNVSTTDLLRKRLTIDRAQVTDASHGEKRQIPGRLIGAPLEPPPSQTGAGDIREGEKTIEDYVREAEEWKARLEQIREWIERLSRPEQAPGGDDLPPDQRKHETLEERLRRQIAEKGYAHVTASHLIEEAPTLLISELIIEGMTTPKLEGEVVDVRGRNLSTHPYLVDATPEIEVKTRTSEKLGFMLALGAAAGTADVNDVRFHFNGLPTDATLGRLRFADNSAPLSGGFLDIKADGAWSTADGGTIEFPLIVTFHNTTLTLPGGDRSAIDHLELPIGVRGPIVSPRVMFDDERFTDALVAAGKARLAERFEEEKGKVIGEAADEIQKKLGEELGGEVGGEAGEQAKKLLDGAFGGERKERDGG